MRGLVHIREIHHGLDVLSAKPPSRLAVRSVTVSTVPVPVLVRLVLNSVESPHVAKAGLGERALPAEESLCTQAISQGQV